MSERYKVLPKSVSAHCCFEATVIDTEQPSTYKDEVGEHHVTVCECFTLIDAERCCLALNIAEDLSIRTGNKL